MTAIVHRTPGLIDPRSFTLMGVSAKPNAHGHAIGMFGTGLKYAIATLVRLGADVTIWIGRDRYSFYKKTDEFRGQEIEHIYFRRHKFALLRPTTHLLPYTTSYGRFWKPWMAFRELHSNTLDEGGETFDLHQAESPSVWFEGDSTDVFSGGREDFTTIVVDHPEYREAWENRDDVFLPGASRQRDVSAGVEILEGESQRLYFRGLRVHDLPKPSLYSYNFVCDMQLTEDRTLYLGDYYARENLAMAVLASEDEAFIERILRADEDHWEHELQFPSYIRPGEAFRRVMARRTRGYSRSSWGYFSSYSAPPSTPSRAPALTLERIRSHVMRAPWTYDEVERQISDADNYEVLRFREDLDQEVCDLLGPEIIERLAMAIPPAVEGQEEIEDLETPLEGTNDVPDDDEVPY